MADLSQGRDPNTLRLDWRLVPAIIVLAGGLVAWGYTQAELRSVDRRLGALEVQVVGVAELRAEVREVKAILSRVERALDAR